MSLCAAVLQTHTAETKSGPENKLVLESLMKRIYLLHRWLDKLGIAALTNHTRVCRQTFVGGAYGLLDSDQYPLPVSDEGGEGRRRGRKGGKERGGEGRGGEEKRKGKRGKKEREGKGEVRGLRWRERKGGRKGRGKEGEKKNYFTSCNCSFRTTGSQCCTRDWLAPGSST